MADFREVGVGFSLIMSSSSDQRPSGESFWDVLWRREEEFRLSGKPEFCHNTASKSQLSTLFASNPGAEASPLGDPNGAGQILAAANLAEYRIAFDLDQLRIAHRVNEHPNSAFPKDLETSRWIRNLPGAFPE